MAAFQFPDPAVQQTVINPITGSTYQWKSDPGKWVLTVSVRKIEEIIWEGENPPIPRGDYKLWYSTDTLELYFWYEDENGLGSWVPTSIPIERLEELIESAAQAELDIDQLQYKQQLLQNAIDQIYLESQTGAGNRPPIFSPTEPDKHPEYSPPDDELIAGDIWYDNTDPDNLEQYIYDGSNWVVFGGQFVHRKGGDSMQGPLKVTGDRNADPDTGVQSSIRVLNVDSGQNSSLQLKHNGTSKVYVGSSNTSFQHDIKFAQDNKQIYCGSDTDKKGLSFYSDGVEYHGNYTENDHVATKLNVEEAIYHDILDPDTNKYVDRSGDIMDGDLFLEESRLVFRNPVGNQTLIRANRDVDKYPKLFELGHNGSGSISGGYDIQLLGNTSYNSLRFKGADTYMEIFAGGGAPQKIKFYTDISMGHNKISKLGQAVDDEDAVTYGQVKEELEELRDKIVGEVALGTWKFDNISSGVTPLAGCFITKKDSNPPQLSPNDINIIRISDEDINGNPGVFDWEIGDLLTFTNVNNTTQSIKFRVNGTPANSGSYWIVSVAHLTSNYDFFQNAEYYLSHINVDVSVDVNALDDTYLRLDCANDPLETELEIKTPSFGEAALTLNGKRDNNSNATAIIAFKNQYNTDENYVGYLSYRTKGDNTVESFFKFNQNVDFSSKGLKNIDFVQFINDGIIKHNDNLRIKFQNRGTSEPGDGLVEFERPTSNGRRGITIRGKDPVDNEDIDILWTYTNASGGDAINYAGKMVADTNIVNKKYVDDAIVAGYGNLPYTIDAEDDTHWGDHRLEDVGHPVDAADASTKGYVDNKITELLARIEELENNSGTGGGSGSMSRNIRIKVKSSTSNTDYLSTNSIKIFNSKDTKLYVCVSPVVFKPQGRINITEVDRGDLGPIWSFHITSVKDYGKNNSGEQVLELGVAFEGPALNGGSYGITSRDRELYLSLVDGAWDEEAVLENPIIIKTTNGKNSWATNTAPVANSGKIYALNSNGNLEVTYYPYGAFIPIDFLQSELSIKYYGLTDNPTGKFKNYTATDVAEVTINGVKGIKVLAPSNVWYGDETTITINSGKISYLHID